MPDSSPTDTPSAATLVETDISVRDQGDGIVVTLQSGDQGNFLGKRELATLTATLDRAEETHKRWVLFEHQGRDLCLGRATSAERSPARGELIGFVERLQSAGVLTIAASDGGSVGFGVGLFALADISLASERAWFQFPEILHGTAPAIVASWLYDRVPYKQGLYWTLTGSRFEAREAVQFGIGTKVVAEGQLARTVAETLTVLDGLDADQLTRDKTAAQVFRGMPHDLASRREVALRWFR